MTDSNYNVEQNDIGSLVTKNADVISKVFPGLFDTEKLQGLSLSLSHGIKNVVDSDELHNLYLAIREADVKTNWPDGLNSSQLESRLKHKNPDYAIAAILVQGEGADAIKLNLMLTGGYDFGPTPGIPERKVDRINRLIEQNTGAIKSAFPALFNQDQAEYLGAYIAGAKEIGVDMRQIYNAYNKIGENLARLPEKAKDYATVAILSQPDGVTIPKAFDMLDGEMGFRATLADLADEE